MSHRYTKRERRALFAPPPGRVVLLWFGGLKVTLELLHFDLGVAQDGVIGALAAPETKPSLQLRIPAYVQMFHPGRAAALQIKTAFPL
jgi:hypothetical protein